jgi:hypothetical protein
LSSQTVLQSENAVGTSLLEEEKLIRKKLDVRETEQVKERKEDRVM